MASIGAATTAFFATLVSSKLSDHWKFSDVVPKLKDESNWTKWSKAIDVGLNAIDKRLTGIVKGTVPRPTPKSDSELRQMVAAREGKAADSVTDMELQYQREAVAQKVEEWDAIAAQCLVLIQSTLSAGPQQVVADLDDVYEVYQKLHARYHKRDWVATTVKYDTWTDLRFIKGGNADIFVQKWLAALQEVQSIRSVDVFVQFHTFIKAIRANPDSSAFISNFKFEVYDDNLMPSVINQFTLYDRNTKLCNATPSAANSAQADADKDNNGRKSGRKRSGKRDDKDKDEKDDDKDDKGSSGQGRPAKGDSGAIWCPHHGHFGDHFPSKCRLPQDKRKGVRKPSAQAAAASTNPKDKDNPKDKESEAKANGIDFDSIWANCLSFDGAFDDTGHAEANLIDTEVSEKALRNLAISAQTCDEDPYRWMLDSGTSHCMSPYKSVFTSYKPCRIPVKSATGERFWTKGIGDVLLDLSSKDRSIRIGSIVLKDVVRVR